MCVGDDMLEYQIGVGTSGNVSDLGFHKGSFPAHTKSMRVW